MSPDADGPVDLEISAAWLVDPVAGREGPADVVVRDGLIEAVTWLQGGDAPAIGSEGAIVAPGFTDLHAHLREPGDEDAEMIASGLAAAAAGGFTTVCLMPDTTPPVDHAGMAARVLALAADAGVPVRALALGCASAGRAGETLAALGELAEAGVVAITDDPSPIHSGSLLRSALAYAGGLGLPVVEHAHDASLSAGAEASEGLVATRLGLRGAPPAAEASAVARDLAILADVVADVPRARLHLAHLSTRASLELVRRAKAAGLPVTCDVTPHHLGMADDWIAGSRAWAWERSNGAGAVADMPFDPSLRVEPPLRSRDDAAACLDALADGTVDAVATDHTPRSAVDKDVEFGLAAPGMPGLETALALLLAAVDAGRLSLGRVVEALTVGPARVLGSPRLEPAAIEPGRPADLVVFDRAERWTVEPSALRTRARHTPLAGRQLSGKVLLTVAHGRLAFLAGDVEPSSGASPGRAATTAR